MIQAAVLNIWTLINYARSEILVPCLVYCSFKQIVDIFFYKSCYQESNILIIAYSSVLTVTEWLDGILSNNKSDRPQLKMWDIWKTLQYLNINDSFHLKDLEISKYQRESKGRW
jgi:hypothetical protein